MIAETITGTILGLRDCGSLVIVYLGTEEGRVIPITLDHRPFGWLLEGEGCAATELVGRSARYDGESLVFLD